MNKTELIAAVAAKAGLSKKVAGEAVDAVVSAVSDALKKGDKVTLIGFGTFEVRTRKARKGVNPATRTPIKIPAAKVPAFKAGKALKDAVARK
ncbi:MAG: HU family DNA-binding protein [Betaproteobacteria bacterium]